MKRYALLFIIITSLIPITATADGYAVPQRSDHNLIVASYNIKWFKMADQDLTKLAQVISRFDVCGILEVKDEKEIDDLVVELERQTGLDWGFTYNFRTNRPGGSYYESYTAVWRKDRAQLGDGVVSSIWDTNESHRNDPYAISFSSGNFDFMLLLVHTRWSDDEDGTRAGEVANLAEFTNSILSFLPEQDIIIAGDFNYSGNADPMDEFEEATEFFQVDPNAKTTFKRNYKGYASPYDHVYIGQNTMPEFIASYALDAGSVQNSVSFLYHSAKRND